MDDGGDVEDGVNLMQAAETDSTDEVSSSLRAMGYTVDGGGGPDRTDHESGGANRSLLEMASAEDVVILLGVFVVLVLVLTLLLT
jgi:hypothetical protein